MLQSVAEYCKVLQYVAEKFRYCFDVSGGVRVAVCCSVLQGVAACCSVLQRLAVSVLQCVDVLMSSPSPVSGLQCIAVCCSALAVRYSVLQCIAVYCSAFQRVAACCSVLQCVAVCCSV